MERETCEHCGTKRTDDVRCGRCGALFRAPDPPIVLGRRFLLERTIGVGSMGVVHLAHDKRRAREGSDLVAVKQVAPEHADDPEARYRFAREAAALASVRHPNVIRVVGVGEDSAGASFVAMEYVPGPSLEQVIVDRAAAEQWLPLPRALAIIRALAAALGAVHAAGFVHRDVKPSNVLLEEGTGRPVLIDFGLARAPARASSKSLGAGTPWYMAPEQVDDEDALDLEISARTDVYALGCTAYEVLTASPPFPSVDLEELKAQHLHAEPPLPSSLRPELLPVDQALLRALAKDPRQRFPTPEALAEALDRAFPC